MAKKESQQDIEKRALFYKMRRWQLGAVVLPILPLIVALAVIMFAGFITPVLIFPVYSIVLFIVFRKKTKRLKAELLEKGGLSPEKEEEYTAIFNKAWTKQIIIWIVMVLVGLFVIWGSRNTSSKKSKYDDVFDKDPNAWTEDEKEYVDNFFEWQKNIMIDSTNFESGICHSLFLY